MSNYIGPLTVTCHNSLSVRCVRRRLPPKQGFMRVCLRDSPREPLINSESFSCVGKMPERRTRSAGPVQIKAPIAGKTQSNRSSQSIRFAHGLSLAHGASFSKAIAKIGNAAMRRSELAYFNKQMLIHELIRGSLVS
jgi:hypothetical protein